MCGAMMVLTGKWNKVGVHTVEELNPDPFIEALDKYGLPKRESYNPVMVD
jgi:saccharopine dehydrogenase (NAD+, L-lysine-forming)